MLPAPVLGADTLGRSTMPPQPLGADAVIAAARARQVIAKFAHEHSRLHLESRDAGDSGSGAVVAGYTCPQQFGNRLQSFISSFAIAVSANRSLLWSPSFLKRDKASSIAACDQFLQRNSWMVPAETLLVRLWGEPQSLGLYYDDVPRRLACLPLEASRRSHGDHRPQVCL